MEQGTASEPWRNNRTCDHKKKIHALLRKDDDDDDDSDLSN